MPANISFTTFVSSTILFANKDAANSFFASITVPDATTVAAGVVKKAALVTFAVSPYDTEDNYELTLGETTYIFPQATHMEAVKERLEYVEAQLLDLLNKLKSAGIVSSV